MTASPADLIRVAARRFGRRAALVEVSLGTQGEPYEGRAIDYQALYLTALRFCSALAQHGLVPGDRVAVLAHNSIELVVTEWACLLAGFVWVALNARSSVAEVHEILDDCQPAVFVVDTRYRDLIPARLPGHCRIVLTGSQWDAFIADGCETPTFEEPGPEDPVRIRYTSGTAGRPKGAVLPRRVYDASIETVSEVIGPLRGEDVLLQVAPMTHAAGAMLLPHVAVGARAVLVDRFDPRGFLRAVAKYGGTAAFLVPTMLVRVLEATDGRPDVGSLRSIVYGGASMPVEQLVRALELFGPVFVQIYGLTESTWPVTALRREDHLRMPNEDDGAWRARLASCGRPTTVGELRIVSDECEVETRSLGEIWVRGRNTMTGYWVAPGSVSDADSKGLDADGWMHTGDVGMRDEQGYITIVDRLHDMIVTGGFNVYPREVEHALCSHPAVLEAAVVGRPDPEWGETVHAAVVLRPGAGVSAEELIAHCGRQIASFKKPRSLEIVEHLPRNPAGKILRRSLR